MRDFGWRVACGALLLLVPATARAQPDVPVRAQEGNAPPVAPPPAPPQMEPGPAPPFSEPAPAGDDAAFGAAPDYSALSLKLYGDTLFQVRDHAPVHTTFAASHLDLFATADVERVSFLSEVFFEADENEFHIDVERLQVAYLVSNWLRIRMGRTHTAFGYYNDTYHHGNLFELTTERPYAAQFEDGGGLFTAHLVGAGIDGSVDAKAAGSFHYDLEVGNGKQPDTTLVAVQQTAKDAKLVNLRLRWLPLDGLIIGINVLHDVVPAVEATGLTGARPKTGELILGAHGVYMEHQVHALLESYLIRHTPSGAEPLTSFGGFGELGYAFGAFTPYLRLELIRFPKSGDAIYQSDGSFYAGARTLVDTRLGVDWHLLPQVVLKLEGQRLAHDSGHQELATFKVAFGF
jgi:hypothetical protein